jgi:hypothetical protein
MNYREAYRCCATLAAIHLLKTLYHSLGKRCSHSSDRKSGHWSLSVNQHISYGGYFNKYLHPQNYQDRLKLFSTAPPGTVEKSTSALVRKEFIV